MLYSRLSVCSCVYLFPTVWYKFWPFICVFCRSFFFLFVRSYHRQQNSLKEYMNEIRVNKLPAVASWPDELNIFPKFEYIFSCHTKFTEKYHCLVSLNSFQKLPLIFFLNEQSAVRWILRNLISENSMIVYPGSSRLCRTVQLYFDSSFYGSYWQLTLVDVE